MGKNSELFLNEQEKDYFLGGGEFYNVMPELPQPMQFKSQKDNERAEQLLEFMQECIRTMNSLKKLITEVDNGQYSDTIFHAVEYRDCLIVNYQHSAILHSQTLDAYMKITGRLSNINQFYNNTKRHTA